MKTFIFILLGLAILIGGFFAYRALVPPSFFFESYDNLNKSGVFVFGGNSNTFNSSSGGTASAYSNWNVVYGSKNGVMTFDLYHNGKFVKNLATK